MSTSTVESGVTVLDELARLDKVIRDIGHLFLVAERLKVAGLWKSEWDAEIEENKAKLAAANRERNWLDDVIARRLAA